MSESCRVRVLFVCLFFEMHIPGSILLDVPVDGHSNGLFEIRCVARQKQGGVARELVDDAQLDDFLACTSMYVCM